MAAGGEGHALSDTSLSLLETPTWALAAVCFVFISVSIFIEHLIHLALNWLKKRRKVALFEALEKLKSVLILLGLMSLILTVTQRPISKICIPTRAASTMHPCSSRARTIGVLKHFSSVEGASGGDTRGNLGRHLAADSAGPSDHCGSKGMEPFISQEGISQLNTFIFTLAVMQIIYSVLTMALGRAKVRSWKAWERETQTLDYIVANDPVRFRYTRDTTFARRHASSFTGTSIQLWIKCFFRQFYTSVAKVDYLTLRHGFIKAHFSSNNSFNFQKYIQRSLEDDFKVLVGISPLMWFVVVIFVLVDAHGWEVYFWLSFIPLIGVLALGTKLEVIVARMALQLKDQNSVIQGAFLVEPNNSLFWFGRPTYVLTILHFTLFLNAFEVAFFVWVTLQFGVKSCYHENRNIIIIRMIVAVIVQVICSYITLPLYALVTQMGSHYKSALLEKQISNAIKQWHAGVRQKRRNQTDDSTSSHHQSSRGGCQDDASSHHHQHASMMLETAIVSGEGTQITETHGEIVEEQSVIPLHIDTQ